MKLITVFIKKNLLNIAFSLFFIFLIIYSNDNLNATKVGLELWIKSVVPSLFPFFIATELLNYTNIAKIFSKVFNKMMRPIFNIPGEGAYAFLMGIVSGYPVGAKIVSDFYSRKKCTKDESERMLAFTNNSGPLFIIGTVGILLFANTCIGVLLLVTHILSSITVGIIYGICSRAYNSSKLDPLSIACPDNTVDSQSSLKDLGNILSSSISKSIYTILQIGGFVILFSIILTMLNNLNIINIFSNTLRIFRIPEDFTKGFVSGIIELTNGVNIISCIKTKNISANIIICAFLLGFGGFSILLQVLGIIAKTGLNIKKYLYGKILQGLIAATYTSLLIHHVEVFNFDITYNKSDKCVDFTSVLLLVCSLLFTLLVFRKCKKQKL